MYDVLIIGGGPAGLTSAIYCLRAGKKVLMIERLMPGGQVALTKNISNYPGFKNIDGVELSIKMFEQATELGLEIVFSDVLTYDINSEIKTVITHEGTFNAKTIILCLGASARELQLENEKKYIGKGVSYCATCDGNLFKNKVVAIVGGGNTAFEDAIFLSNLAKKVYIVHRRDAFRTETNNFKMAEKLSVGEDAKIEFVLNSVVTKLNGDDKLESIDLENKLTKNNFSLKVDGLFIAIGRKPDTESLIGKVNLDENGYIITDENMCTNIAGVFACGDVRQKRVRQIVTACADGAIVASSINEYLQKRR